MHASKVQEIIQVMSYLVLEERQQHYHQLHSVSSNKAEKNNSHGALRSLQEKRHFSATLNFSSNFAVRRAVPVLSSETSCESTLLLSPTTKNLNFSDENSNSAYCSQKPCQSVKTNPAKSLDTCRLNSVLSKKKRF